MDEVTFWTVFAGWVGCLAGVGAMILFACQEWKEILKNLVVTRNCPFCGSRYADSH